MGNRVPRPAIISFSGGPASGFNLWETQKPVSNGDGIAPGQLIPLDQHSPLFMDQGQRGVSLISEGLVSGSVFGSPSTSFRSIHRNGTHAAEYGC